MKSTLFEKDVKKWAQEQVNILTDSILEAMKEKQADEFKYLDDRMLHVIYFQAVFNVIKVINFPPSLEMTVDQRKEIFKEYEEFAHQHLDTFTDACDALFSWEPEHVCACES